MTKGRIYDHELNRLFGEPSLPEFGNTQNIVRTRTIPLDTALEDEPIEIVGSVLYCVEATTKNATAKVKFNERVGDGFLFKEGSFIAGIGFSRLFITASAQAGESITLMYAVETDEIRIINPAEQQNDVDLIKGSDFQGVADVTLGAAGATTIISADSTRRSAFITNLSGNAATIRVGGVGSVGAAQGTPVAPGETLTLSDCTDGVAAYNPGGAQDVAVSAIYD